MPAPSIDALFQQLRAQGRKALMPFITAGDPDLAFTAELLPKLIQCGGNIVEVGIPYSDPIADGPVVQASYTRALEHRIKLKDIFATLATTTPIVAAPVVTMVSYAIVYRHGIERYVNDVQQAGIAGLIVPDLPAEEAGQLSPVCRKAGLSLIQLVTPTTPRERAVRIAETSTGFLYYVSVAGITGERTELPPELVDNVGWLRTKTALPICIGFGISRPEHVRKLAPVADGLIVGSAIVRRVAEASKRPRADVIGDIAGYVRSLAEALADVQAPA